MMMRLTALMSLTMAAVSAERGFLVGFEEQRDLQNNALDQLQDFNFNIAGVNVNQTTAENNCPNQWTPAVQCVIRQCLNFQDVCDLTFDDDSLQDNIGTAAENNKTETSQEDLAALVPECDEISDLFCDLVGSNLNDGECCLDLCLKEFRALGDCMILEETGVNRSDCPTPQCEAPVEPNGPDTTNQVNEDGAGSLATSVVFAGALAAAAFLA